MQSPLSPSRAGRIGVPEAWGHGLRSLPQEHEDWKEQAAKAERRKAARRRRPAGRGGGGKAGGGVEGSRAAGDRLRVGSCGLFRLLESREATTSSALGTLGSVPEGLWAPQPGEEAEAGRGVVSSTPCWLDIRKGLPSCARRPAVEGRRGGQQGTHHRISEEQGTW